MRRHAVTLTLLTLGVGAMVWILSKDPRQPEPAPPDSPPRQPAEQPSAPITQDPPSPQPTPTPSEGALEVVEPPQLTGPRVQFLVEGAAAQAPVQAILGGAGIYPAVEATADAQSILRLPQDPLTEPIFAMVPRRYEVFAATPDGAHALWGALTLEPQELATPEVSTDGSIAAPRALAMARATPLIVDITDERGQPVAGATLMLSIDPLSVIRQTRVTDQRGRAQFDAIPDGEYSLMVRSSSYVDQRVSLTQQGAAAKTIAPQRVVMTPGREVFGCVVDAAGAGVASVVVDAHVDRRGQPGEVTPARLLRVDAPPVFGSAIADLQGCFSLSGLPAGVTYLVARGARAMPAISAPLDLRQQLELGPVELKMDQGVDVSVFVRDPEGRSVPGATVRWSAQPSGLEGALVSDERGLVLLQGVPAGIAINASLRQFSSPSYTLSDPSPEGDYTVEVVLDKRSNLKDYRVRLIPPAGVEPVDVQVLLPAQEQRAATSCLASQERAQDWFISACPEGKAWIEVQTQAHGLWRAEITSGQDLELKLPPPREAIVRVEGLDAPSLEASALSWRAVEGDDALDRLVSWSEPVRPKAPVGLWRAALYPGGYALNLIDALTQERWSQRLLIPDDGAREPVQLTWSIKRTVQTPIYVIDVRGRPIQGAQVFWLDPKTGKRQPLGLSQGRAGLSYAYRGALKGMLLAGIPREGEGTLALDGISPSKDGLVLTVDSPSLSIALSGRVRDLALIERALGASIVQDNGALLLDVTDPLSAASKAGVPRGAALIDAWRDAASLHLWVMYRGSGQQINLPLPK